MSTQPIRWFSEVGLDDVMLVGGKGANLGELTRAGLPVPPGFVVTSEAYSRIPPSMAPRSGSMIVVAHTRGTTR